MRAKQIKEAAKIAAKTEKALIKQSKDRQKARAEFEKKQHKGRVRLMKLRQKAMKESRELELRKT